MDKEIQQETKTSKITRAAMEAELGNTYKRCWAYAFQYASEELDYDLQVENLCREFDLIKPQAEWFTKGANAILFKQEAKQKRKASQSDNTKENEQQQLANYSSVQSKKPRNCENYVSQLEMMSFLEDIEEMNQNPDFIEFWNDLKTLKEKILEQQCATEKEVIRAFKIRSMVETANEGKERFFDAYPISTDAWENGHFDVTGEVIFN